MSEPQWVQGALLDPSACEVKDLDGLTLEVGDVLIVITQSCDIARHDEQYVEVHVGRALDAVDGNNTHRKNPRTLDLDTEVNGTKRAIRILQSDRRKIPQTRLEKAPPIGLLPDADIRLLARWTAARYTRPALPDAFNRRRKASIEAIRKIASRSGVDLSGVWITLNSDAELPDGEDYEVFVLGTILHVAAIDVARRNVAFDATKEIAEALQRCIGIVVVDSETRSEKDVSIDEIKRFNGLELDHISERGGLVNTLYDK